MIAEDYVSFEITKLLKEKGFDESTLQRYDTDGDMSSDGRTGKYNSLTKFNFIAAPTLQMVMKWLREKNLFIEIFIPSHSDHEDTIYHDTYSFDLFNLKTKKYMYCTYGEVEYNSYEEACEVAIKYCLENLI